MTSDTRSDRKEHEHEWPKPAYAWYMTFLLMVLYMFSFLDRTIIVLLIEPIKRDLQLTDTHVSLLYGLAFAIFYTIMGIPIARLADSKNRRSIVAVGVLVWSAMTAACGLAKDFGQLFLARIGVGVGEAALSPAAYSLISDSFPEEKRARAMSVYTMGLYLGVGMALLLGGAVIEWVATMDTVSLPVLGEMYSWQLTFVIVGAPGLVFFVLVMALREPARQGIALGARVQVIPLGEAMGWFLQRKRFYLSFYLAMTFITLYSYSLTAWTPSFFIRTHDWTTLQVSQNYGMVMLIFGPAGILAGGWLASRQFRRGDELANARMATYAFLGLLIPAATMTLVDSAWVSLGLVAVIKFLSGLPLGVAMAAVHEVTPNRLRAQAAAIYLFLLNILGLGTGPTIVALLTDYAFGDPAALRYSLAIVGVGACLAGLLLSVYATGQLRILKQELARA
ncbi:spinster family MFS transporter [Pseudohalioglobus lutimaris]|uniref:MFS transporter n=1 Tax=Pseudohalioglobus lutimaris TaxID=1737061 RepID=A0A2N5X715_9GAMM|nr:MFS transporter [Pseudohalioglobus lutimaris]PLW70271.1 MFS transporter [Pseudohalioglobus lutimaris]